MVRIAAWVAVCLTLASFACAQEQVTQEQVDQLVARLVSPNEAPKAERGVVVYPEGFDREAQREVVPAYNKLCDFGPAAFPFLFDHFSDERYATTRDDGSVDVNYSVGDLCVFVVDMQLQPCQRFTRGEHDPRERPRRPHYFSHFRLNDLKSARSWWRARKDKSLRELQIEVLEWIHAEETRRETDFEEVERTWIAQSLAELKASKDPLEPGAPWSR